MPTRGPLTRLLLGLGLVAGAAFAVVGGLALPPSGLVAVALAGVVAGGLAWGVSRESSGRDSRATVEAAWRTAAATVTVLIVLSGAATLGGAQLTLLVAAGGGAVALGVWAVRGGRSALAGPGVPMADPFRPADVPARPADVPVRPVADLSTGELGREWVRTTAALGGRLDPRTRQALVTRRQETLDELERRDPAGFARWLAAGPFPGSDPAGHLRHGDPAA
ncbi:hypothetical protein ACI79C_21895 [Geodermatophilus sp. SYSU D00697]